MALSKTRIALARGLAAALLLLLLPAAVRADYRDAYKRGLDALP